MQQQLQKFQQKSEKQIVNISCKHVLSISGINIIKRIIIKHIELMTVCRSHCFEIFVSLTNLLRFYTYIVANVFVGKTNFNVLYNDVILYGYYPDSEGNAEMVFTDEDLDRANVLLMTQQKYAELREEIFNM